MNKIKGIVDPVSLCLIIACLGAGVWFMFGTNTIDSPLEELAEDILESKGIDIDFSASKKLYDKD